MRRLYALFVAVDRYASPGITPLRGCVKDIRSLESFLLDQYDGQIDLHIRLLENEQATYRNVIDTFKAHLMQAGPDDTAWFHFSGHGSEELTAFPKLIEPTGKEQTLLCHDSQSGDVPNLADKELAALLHDVAARFPDGTAKESPHLVVSLDACHSGSGTRDIGDELITPRAVPASGGTRSLESYYEGYYARQEKLDIPLSKHLLMSACEHIQTAGDTTRGGIFSTSLVSALKQTRGNVNYVDLFQRTRASAKRLREFQNPQFQALSNFNPYTRFLTGEPMGRPDKYEVLEEKGDWYIKCGAVHGLPTSPGEPIEVEIRTPDPEDKKIGEAVIVSVGAQKSKLDVRTGFSLKNLIDQIVPGQEAYQGVIMQFPAEPFLVSLNDEGGSLDGIRGKWRDDTQIVIAGAEQEEEAMIEVSIDKGHYVITDRFLNQRAFESADAGDDSAGIIVDALGRIANWYRTWALKNDNTHSKLAELVDFHVKTEDKTAEHKQWSGSQVKIYLNKDNTIENAEFGLDPEMRMLMLHPRAVIKNAKQDLYFYLLQFRTDYSIACDEDEVKFVYDIQQYTSPYEVTQALWKSTTSAAGLLPGQDETTTRFKLITTTEELDIAQITQEQLKGERSSGTIRLQRAKISNDWWVHNMEITMIRQDSEISPDKPVLLADGQVRIEPHPTLTAKVSTGNASGGTRSSDPVHLFNALQHTALQLETFGTERTLEPRNVIELDQMHVPEGTDLESSPLEIVLSRPAEDGWTLPVMFDGRHFIATGDSEGVDGQTVVRIREIPRVQFDESADGGVLNPFVPEVQDRSLFQAAKLAFFRLVLKKDELSNRLRRAVFSEEGGVDLTDEDISSKVAAAERTLVVVHGLLGNTSSMLREIRMHSPEQLEPYDLVLAFDYENLNQKLDDTAAALRDALGEVGIDGRKQVAILAHGSGGLVARWLVEQLSQADAVEKLIMFGTPNAGTTYGKIGTYRKFASSAMDLALNFIPDLIPGSGLIMKSLNTAADLTGSLADMHPASDFMNRLNSSPDPGVRYEIYCGDIGLAGETGTGVRALLDKVQRKLGDLIQPGTQHDLFSTVDSMQNRDAWTGRSPEPVIMPVMPATHFSYFSRGLSAAEPGDAPAAGSEGPTATEDEQSEIARPGSQSVPEKALAAEAAEVEEMPAEPEAEPVPPGSGEHEIPTQSDIVKALSEEVRQLKEMLAEKEAALQEAIRKL